MTDPLAATEIERMRAEHVEIESSFNGIPRTECKHCLEGHWPCDAARLLDHMTLDAWWRSFPAYSGSPVDLPMEFQPDGTYGLIVVGRDPRAHLPMDVVHCHCGAEGMEPTHPVHAALDAAKAELARQEQGIGPVDEMAWLSGYTEEQIRKAMGLFTVDPARDKLTVREYLNDIEDLGATDRAIAEDIGRGLCGPSTQEELER